MKYSTNCPFCKETRFENNKFLNLPYDDCILYESKNLYIQVDISPLSLGHILIIPQKHYYNFYELPKNLKIEINQIKKKIIKLYKNIYKSDVLFFEHGSIKSDNAGASIVHAHLHCIPFNNIIYKDLNKILGKPIKCDILSIKNNFNNEFPYIYIESKKNKKKLYIVNNLKSQFLREFIANKFNKEEYLWQNRVLTKSNYEIMIKTINDLKGKIFI